VAAKYKKRKQIDQKIVELFEKGNTYRHIAEQLEISFRDIFNCVKMKQKQKRIADYKMEEAVLDYKINFKKALLKDLEREEQRIRAEIANLKSENV
jgi:hypothetical protein